MEFEVVSESENFCFIVEVLDVCVSSAVCDDSECSVLCCLDLV